MFLAFEKFPIKKEVKGNESSSALGASLAERVTFGPIGDVSSPDGARPSSRKWKGVGIRGDNGSVTGKSNVFYVGPDFQNMSAVIFPTLSNVTKC